MKNKKGWELVKLGEVVFFQEGPGVRNFQFKTSGVKLLNVGNINNGNLNLDATKIFISEEEAYGKYKHFLIDEGDLLIASSGIVVDNFHNKVTWADKEHLPLCLNTSTIRFKSLDKNILDIRFFSFFLKTRLFSNQLSKLITGSAQLN
jgi:type I restriction enzyme S subunit